MALSRRQILAALSTMPGWSSLLSRVAVAQSVPTPKFYVHFCTTHGAVWRDNMFPAQASPETRSYGGRTIRRQPLQVAVANGRAALSPVLSGASGVFTQRLASKMNVIQGLDWPFYLAHHTGGHLGNIARNDGNGGDGLLVQAHPRVTIDQLMARSPEFYPQAVRQRVLTMGSRISYERADQNDPQSAIQEVAGSRDSSVWYDRLFPPGTMTGGTQRPAAVNRVKEDYARLLASSRRLSGADRARLEQHVQRLDELKGKLDASTATACTQPGKPAQSNRQQFGAPYVGDYDVNPGKQIGSSQMLNDLIVAAFTCGLSRVAVLASDSNFTTFTGDYHQSVAHRADQLAPAPDGADPLDPQHVLAGGNQQFFEGVMLDLVAKLDATSDGQGGTLLDHSLVVWSQESGNHTHSNFSTPVITFGGAGGYFSTGHYVDYRNLSLGTGSTEKDYPGLLMHQWLGMSLRAMGVPHAQWAESDHGGYSYRYAKANWTSFTTEQAYPDSLWALNGDDLPWLKR